MVYCGGLENRCGLTPTGGSNPSLSARIIFVNNNWIHIAIWAVVIGAAFLWEELKGSTALISIMIALLGGFVVLVDTILFKIFIH